MKRITRDGNIIVATMLGLILVMFCAAMMLDAGLIKVPGLETAADANVLAKAEDLRDSVIVQSTVSKGDSGHSIDAMDAKPIETTKKDISETRVKKVQSKALDNTGGSNAVKHVVRPLDRKKPQVASPKAMPNEAKQGLVNQSGAKTGANQSKPKQNKPKQSLANQSGAKRSKASQSGAKRSKAKRRVKQRVVSSVQPRDIVFVVDLSGSMNDDTENAWATQTIQDTFKDTGFAEVGENIVQQFYTDMNFGNYPGPLQYIGEPLEGIPASSDAYNKLTMNDGPLTQPSVGEEYRIYNSDDEQTRKVKAYRWMIDKQIAVVMPRVKPAPNSDYNYEYWEKYLDYIMVVKFVGNAKKKKKKKKRGAAAPVGPSPGIGQNQTDAVPHYAAIIDQAQPMSRLAERGWIPPNVDRDRIYRFNNPNSSAYPNADETTRWNLRNKIGYRTYTQFLLDWGRDGKPEDKTYVESSINSAHCPYHDEDVNGEKFSFPPRTQPMNSVRRSLIAALQTIRDRNDKFGKTSQRDLVSIMTFDTPDNGISIKQTLTDDYQTAMNKCCKLQATQDVGSSTATEIGLKNAYQYLRPVSQGGAGRQGAKKVVILLTDGQPNAHVSANSDIDVFMSENPDDENFYGAGHYWLDAALMQGKIMQAKNWYIYPVGIGFGTDYDFMDRMARIGATSQNGKAIRGTGNPAQYEQTLKTILNQIMTSTKVKFVK